GWCADVCGTGVALRVTSSWPSSRTRKQAVPGAPSTWWTNTPNCSPTVTRRSARSGAFRSRSTRTGACTWRSEEHTSELQSRFDLVCRLLLEKKELHAFCSRRLELDHLDLGRYDYAELRFTDNSFRVRSYVD